VVFIFSKRKISDLASKIYTHDLNSTS
jgi:antiviral helicase SKI2